MIALAGLSPALAAQASAAVGTIPGAFGVTATGAATYTIPIQVPRGAGGLTPSIALVYDSQSGSGAAGWGWALSGLSAITRCNKTIDADNVTQAAQFQSSDDYCLDGARLRVTNGTSGASATYDTELRRYDRITSYTDSSATGGPSYWTVEAKDGTTYEYGNTSDSRIYWTNPAGGAKTMVRVWALDKVTDANGNYYTVSYQNNDATTGGYWPTEIDYSGNTHAGHSPDHTVSFGWSARSAASAEAHFVAGGLVTETELLSTVTVSYQGSAALTYYLSYQSDPNNGRNQLAEVQECAPNSSGSCLGPTEITWQSAGSPGWQSPVAVSGVGTLSYTQAMSVHLADVNGDGIDDLLFPGASAWMIAYGEPGGGFGSPVTTNIALGNYQWALAGDVNGDGRMDLMVPETSDNTWHVYESDGATDGQFTDVATGLADTGTNSVAGAPIYEGSAALVDYSGRGLGDFLYSDGTTLWLAANNGPGHSPQFASPQNVGSFSLSSVEDGFDQWQSSFVDAPMDFGGAGRVGRLGYSSETVTPPPCDPEELPGCTSQPPTTTYYWTELASTPSGYQASGGLDCERDNDAPLPLAAIGSGLTDLLVLCQPSDVTAIDLTTGYLGVAGPGVPGFMQVSLDVPWGYDDPVIADYDEGGRDEALLPTPSSGWYAVRVNYDPATSKFVATSTSVTAPLPSNYGRSSLRVGHIEAEGLDDLVFAEVNYDYTAYTLYYELHNPVTAAAGYPDSGAIPDTVVNITDGLGNSFSPEYARLTDTSAYTGMGGAAYPVENVEAPLAIVTGYTANDGTGGSYSETYHYTGARQEVTGHGFLGFASRTATDSRNGVIVEDSYQQVFPFTGDLSTENVTQADGKSLSGVANTYADTPATPDGETLYFPDLSQSIATAYDADSGTAIKTVETQNTFGDSYGNLTGQTVTTTDKTTGEVFTTSTATTYANSAASGDYCIALPTEITVTRTNAQGTLVRGTSSPQDTSACRPQYVEMYPGASSGNTPSLKTTYGYDSWGNVETATLSGTNIAENHVTTTDYSAYNGEYPDSIAHSGGGIAAETATETWDPARGVELAETDPNGLVTHWGYDGFGRKTGETLPTGLALGWTYGACGSALGTATFGAPAHCAYGIGETSNAQTEPVGATLYDAKGRAIETEKWLLDDAVSIVQTRYDSLGRAIAVSKPSLGATPGYWTDTSYDVLNRPIGVTAPANQNDSSNSDVTTIGYDGFTATATTSAPGNPNVASETTSTVTDALGEVVSKTDGGSTTTYTYDAFGDLLQTKDAGNHTTTIGYDGLGHKISMDDPNMGSWAYSVDALGEVLAQTDADGNTITQGYDALGRRTTRVEKNPGGTVTASDTWTWDTAAHGVGRLATETDSASGFEKAYTYDSAGRPVDVDTTVNGTDYQVSTSYDSFGRIATVTYPVSTAPSAITVNAAASPSAAVVGNNLTLSATATDPEGLAMSYQWTQTAGPATATLGSPTSAQTSVTTSTPGNYTFEVVVTDQNIVSAPASVNVTFVPPAPGTPTFSPPSPSYNGSYTVNWTGAANESYELYESSDGSNYGAPTTESGTSVSVSGKTDGTYYYKVAACENGVCGAESAAASITVTLPPGTAPAAGSLNLTPNPSTTGSFTLSWGSVATATSYKVLRSANGGAYGAVTTTSNLSYPTSEGDGTYGYEVESCNAAGCSNPSSAVTETVTLPPGTPATPSASPDPSTSGSFTVTWSAPGGSYTGMQFQESPNGSSWTTKATSGTSWNASGFGNGTYYFRTIYCDGSACSTSGTGTESVTLPPGTPGTPSASPNPSGNGSFTVSWSAPGGSYTSMAFQESPNGSSWTTEATGGSSWNASGFGNGTYYLRTIYCEASACSTSGTGSEQVLYLPGVPPSVTASPTTLGINQMFELQWGTASGSVGYYQVNGSGADTTRSASIHEMDVTPLGVGTFSYTVQACNAAGCSGDSNTVRVTVQNGGGPGCPTCPPGGSPFDVKGKVSPQTKPATPVPPASTRGGMQSASIDLPVGAAVSVAIQNASPALNAGAMVSVAIPNIPNAEAVMSPGAANVPTVDVQGSVPIAMPNSVTARLTRERQALTADVSPQPSEAQLQAAANLRARAGLPSLLPAAPASDMAAWNEHEAQWKKTHPNGPDYAPPEYLAYANVKLEPAQSSAYRFEVQYSYDAGSGALTAVSNTETGFVYWQAASGGAAPVDAYGHLIGWTDGNDVSTVEAYDAATGLPVGISTGVGQSSSVQQLAYAWDGYGNLTERQDANQSLTETFAYDELNRLTNSTVTNPSANGPTLGFGYDAVGNITSKTVAGVTSTYTYDTNHPYAVDNVTNVNGGTYTASYDADGNMTSRNGSAITWTPANLPASITGALGSSTFNYDPDGNRYSQSAQFNSIVTNTTYIAGGLFEVVASSSDTEYRHNILADGQIVAVHTIDSNHNASTDYLHYDQLGSVDAITNGSGSVIQSMSFDAFGNRRLATSWDYGVSQSTLATLNDYTNRGYTDQEQLDDLSLVDMNGRVYDPTVGRFISADPTVPAPMFSQAFNRYSYTYNSPLEYTDPSGFTDTRLCSPASHGVGCEETGSHIAGVDTGATCSGDCLGWGPFGPGAGSGGGSGGSSAGRGGGSGSSAGSSADSGSAASSSCPPAYSVCATLPQVYESATCVSAYCQGLTESEIYQDVLNFLNNYVTATTWRSPSGVPTEGVDSVCIVSCVVIPILGEMRGLAEGAKIVEDTIQLPPNRGFVPGYPNRASVLPGQKLDRYGGAQGTFLSVPGTPPGARSLPPGAINRAISTYEVIRPFDVDVGPIEPWYGQPGGGLQFDTYPNSVQELIEKGYLKKVPGLPPNP